MRRMLVLASFGAGGVLLAAGAAWGCAEVVAIPSLESDQTAVLSGSQVTVRGTNFTPGPVNVWWAGADAQLQTNLADATATATADEPSNATFSVQVTIPDVAPGTYYLTGVQTATNTKGSMPLTVRAASTTAPTNGSGNYVTSNSANANELFAPESTAVPAASSTATSPVPRVSSPAAAAISPQAPTPSAASASARPAAASPAPQAPGSAPLATGAVTADSQPASTEPTAAVAPSSRSFARDLWNGFSQGTGPALPSLVDEPVPGGSTPGLAIGLGLALGAIVALGSGFVVAEARRRRAYA